ncbi:MAG: Flp family type IVb pilin [Acidobacteriaceae bacterium]|jgi:pilus assembly protein Flp/PilA
MSFQSRSGTGQVAWQRSLAAVPPALQRLLFEESGQDMIEYCLIATLIGLGTLLTVHGAANTIVNMILQVGTSFTNDV